MLGASALTAMSMIEKQKIALFINKIARLCCVIGDRPHAYS